RPDVDLYGADLEMGEHRALYVGWEMIDLDAGSPTFPGINLNAFYTTHLIEHLAEPQRLIRWLGDRAEPNSRLYVEWPDPSTAELPTCEDLRKSGVEVVMSNFADDLTHKESPDPATLIGWLAEAGFSLISSGTIDAGIFGEELFARGTDSDTRTMGYWSIVKFSHYAVAIKPGMPTTPRMAAASVATANGVSAAVDAATLHRLREDAAPPVAAAAAPEEIITPFTEMSEWDRFSDARPHLFDKDFIAGIVDNAKQNGVRSAFLGHIPAEEVNVAGTEYREHLLARGLNSRCRAVLELIAAEPWHAHASATIYAAEAVTPFALLMRGRFPRFVGSEYAQDEALREALFPIPVEDLGDLTHPPDRFDCVVTNDCLEHVPDIGQCLREMHRVLRRGGILLSTFPFTFMYDSVVRARFTDGQIEHLEEPEYHGNPAEPEARSLVFEIPGWNILERARQAGFGRAELVFVSGREQATTASEVAGIFVLRCYK
ncbi:MAG: class I SAM-dependent methyltransferase, partial [Alphaproteobacteria bacterium]|nr:class I SAM-dependent methyltransferase [Alphaproteobacteria bacterium]